MVVIRRPHVVAAAMLFLLGGIVGCGTADSPAHTHDDGPAVQHNFDVVQIAEDTTDYQRPMLADGVVTFEEYERATLAAIECIRSEGIVVDGPEPMDGDSRFLMYYMVAEGLDHDRAFEQMQPVGDRCDGEYIKDVARVWEYQNLVVSPSPAA